MTETCGYCGVVDENVCRNKREENTCFHGRIESGPLSGLKVNHYGVIYADPPWSWKSYSKPEEGTVPHRSEEAPYKSMTAEDLLSLPVHQIAAKDCVLHMWVISSHIDQAFALAKQWGFTFKSFGFNWVKTQKHNPEAPKMGMGKWLRQESEICLLFTCGKPKRVSAGVRQVILEPAREHSRKPDVAYERIEALSAGPYLEMFSRANREGWDVMGDQTGKFDGIDPLEAAEIEDLI